MAEKPLTLEDLARGEAAELKKREQSRKAYTEAQKRLVTELPARFMELGRAVRDGVRRFNDTAYKESGNLVRGVRYEESVAMTARDPNLGGEVYFRIARAPNSLTMTLRTMTRAGKCDAYVMDGRGSVGVPPTEQGFVIRIEALVRASGDITYRATCNGDKIDTPLEDMPDHLVALVVTGQLSRLWIVPPWTEAAGTQKPSIL